MACWVRSAEKWHSTNTCGEPLVCVCSTFKLLKHPWNLQPLFGLPLEHFFDYSQRKDSKSWSHHLRRVLVFGAQGLDEMGRLLQSPSLEPCWVESKQLLQRGVSCFGARHSGQSQDNFWGSQP